MPKSPCQARLPALEAIITSIMTQESILPHPLHILHLEDSVLDHQLVRRALDQSLQNYAMERVETLPGFEQQIRASDFDVILADYRLPGFTALDAWTRLQQLAQRPPFILVSGAIGEPAAVSAIKMGISDYLSKDDLARLGQVIGRALEMHQMRRDKELADAELALSEQRLAKLSEHLQTTIEQERASIAREIHDDIGGALAAVRFDLAWVVRHSVDAPTQSHLSTANEMLQQAIEASQRIMMNLRPAILDQGLAAAIEWLAAGFARRTGIKTQLQLQPLSSSLSAAVQLVAYRTTQEALTNIAKHAACASVAIELSDAEAVLTLEVRDDGLGIAPDERDKPLSFGLRGLHERAKSVGGWLDVSSRHGSGTALILSVPLLAVDSPVKP